MLYVIAALLTILWAVGFFALNAGVMIHLLIPAAGFLIILKLLRKNKNGKHRSFKPLKICIKK